jgi:hypothetical protein
VTGQAERVHAETMRLRKINEKARAKREARAKAKVCFTTC